MKVSDVMVSPVVVTQKNKTIKHARSLFDRKKINALPVLAMDGEIEGIITVSDVAGETDDNKMIEQVMTTQTHVVNANSGIIDAAKMMEKHQVHHLVVMDNGQVVGIISAMDFVSLYIRNWY